MWVARVFLTRDVKASGFIVSIFLSFWLLLNVQDKDEDTVFDMRLD